MAQSTPRWSWHTVKLTGPRWQGWQGEDNTYELIVFDWNAVPLLNQQKFVCETLHLFRGDPDFVSGGETTDPRWSNSQFVPFAVIGESGLAKACKRDLPEDVDMLVLFLDTRRGKHAVHAFDPNGGRADMTKVAADPAALLSTATRRGAWKPAWRTKWKPSPVRQAAAEPVAAPPLAPGAVLVLHYAGRSWNLERLTVDFYHEFQRTGKRVGKRWPKHIHLRADRDLKMGLADVVCGGLTGLLTASPRVAALLHGVKFIELLPMPIRDAKGHLLAKDFQAVHLLKVIDCVDVAKTVATRHRLLPAVYGSVTKLRLDEAKIPADVALFRVRELPHDLFVRRELAETLRAAGVQQIAFQSVAEFRH